MKRVSFFAILILIVSAIQLHASETGTITVFTFKEGRIPLPENEVIVGDRTYFTDLDGVARVTLEAGQHQVQIVGINTDGKNLGYYKKFVDVVAGKDTEIIANFYDVQSNNRFYVDTPVAGSTAKEMDFSRVGMLKGAVLTSDKNVPISNARIFVKGTSIDARTDDSGQFAIEIPADQNVSISVVHSEYSAQTINDIVVKEGQTIAQEVKLTPASMELEEFVVLAPEIKGSISSIMAEEKESKSIVNILGSEEMSKKGDSDAASALKRVTGVTLIDGADIYVRGLGDRYSNVEMNSLPLPSPNPIKRTVPLDLFPSGVISSLKVQKSATADIPANWGGGYIDIRTKDQANEDYVSIALELKGNSNTGKDVWHYQGGGSDWLGIDDGYREVPQDILNESAIVVGEPVNSFDTAHGYTKEELNQFMIDIVDRELTPYKGPLPYGGKLGIEGAYNFEVADDHLFTIFANYTYEQDHKYREEEYFKYAYDRANDQLYKEPDQFGKTYQTRDKYKHSAIFNVGYNFADVLKVKYTKLYTLDTEGVTNITDGIANSDDDWKIRYDLNWEERQLDVDQISGNTLYNLFDVDNDFHFGAEQAKADLWTPGNVKYAYLRDLGFDGTVLGDPFLHRYTFNGVLNLSTKDDMTAYYLRNRSMVEMFDDEDFIEIGYAASDKERESRYNKYEIYQGSNPAKPTDDIDTIYDEHVRDDFTNYFSVNMAFQPAYWYDATVVEHSYYAMMFVKPIENLDVQFGMKHVDWSQTLYEYTNNNDALAPIELVPHNLKFDDWFPSFSAKYHFSKSDALDFAYSKTFIVPDLREFTDAEYFHPYEVATVRGNSELVNTFIYSYDLKYSHYFSDTENIALGTFYKLMEDPIEDVQLPSSSLDRYGFINSDQAILYGFEIDGRKSFDFIDNGLKHYFLMGNFSYTHSDVSLTEEQQQLYTNNHRQLQGLSPTVINVSLAYDTIMRSVTLSYNKMGERIRKVGMIDGNDEYPDYYEVPPNLLDFVWIEKFESGVSLRLKVSNILDDKVVWKQGGQVTRSYKNGTDYSFRLQYKF